MFEVQTYVLDGWSNIWMDTDEDGNSSPATFGSFEDAQAALDEFLDDIAAEIAAGTREIDSGYSADDFRIVKIN